MISTYMFSLHTINASTTKTKRTNLTSIISTTLQITRESSTKVIQSTSVVSSVLAASTASPPVAFSKQRIVAINMTISNKVYTNQLSNKSSKEYTELAREVIRTVGDIRLYLLSHHAAFVFSMNVLKRKVYLKGNV